MRKFLVLLLALGLMSGAGVAMAQEPGATANASKEKQAANEPMEKEPTAAEMEKEPTAAEMEKALTTLQAYKDEMKQLKEKAAEHRKVIKENNAALAKTLGKADDYDENEVKAAHEALMAGKALLAETELKMCLLNKKIDSRWAPETDGREVRITKASKKTKTKK